MKQWKIARNAANTALLSQLLMLGPPVTLAALSSAQAFLNFNR